MLRRFYVRGAGSTGPRPVVLDFIEQFEVPGFVDAELLSGDVDGHATSRIEPSISHDVGYRRCPHRLLTQRLAVQL